MSPPSWSVGTTKEVLGFIIDSDSNLDFLGLASKVLGSIIGFAFNLGSPRILLFLYDFLGFVLGFVLGFQDSDLIWIWI